MLLTFNGYKDDKMRIFDRPVLGNDRIFAPKCLVCCLVRNFWSGEKHFVNKTFLCFSLLLDVFWGKIHEEIQSLN